MFEDLWNGILELTSRFVIPDWGSVIAMLPVLIFALAILVIVAVRAAASGGLRRAGRTALVFALAWSDALKERAS